MTRKELVNEYKSLKPRVGVFQIRNLANGKIFLEGSVNLDKIWNRHRTELDFGGHRNKDLQRDWKQYGESNFVFEILSEIDVQQQSEADVKKELKLLEQLYVEELQPYEEKGYHSRPKF